MKSDKTVKITLYVDEQLKTRFMGQILEDVQTLAGNAIVKISSQVRKPSTNEEIFQDIFNVNILGGGIFKLSIWP